MVHSRKYRKEDKLKLHIILKLSTSQRKQTTQNTAKKLLWFSQFLWHSARKRCGLILQCSWVHMGLNSNWNALVSLIIPTITIMYSPQHQSTDVSMLNCVNLFSMSPLWWLSHVPLIPQTIYRSHGLNSVTYHPYTAQKILVVNINYRAHIKLLPWPAPDDASIQ